MGVVAGAVASALVLALARPGGQEARFSAPLASFVQGDQAVVAEEGGDRASVCGPEEAARWAKEGEESDPVFVKVFEGLTEDVTVVLTADGAGGEAARVARWRHLYPRTPILVHASAAPPPPLVQACACAGNCSVAAGETLANAVGARVVTPLVAVMAGRAWPRRDSDLAFVARELGRVRDALPGGTVVLAGGLVEGAGEVISVPCHTVVPHCDRAMGDQLVQGYRENEAACMLCDVVADNFVARAADLAALGAWDEGGLGADARPGGLSAAVRRAARAAGVAFRAAVCPEFVTRAEGFEAATFFGAPRYVTSDMWRTNSTCCDERGRWGQRELTRELAMWDEIVNQTGLLDYVLTSGSALAAIKLAGAGTMPWDKDNDVQARPRGRWATECSYTNSVGQECAPPRGPPQVNRRRSLEWERAVAAVQAHVKATSERPVTLLKLVPADYSAIRWAGEDGKDCGHGCLLDVGHLDSWFMTSRFGFADRQEMRYWVSPFRRMRVGGLLLPVTYSPAKHLALQYGRDTYLGHAPRKKLGERGVVRNDGLVPSAEVARDLGLAAACAYDWRECVDDSVRDFVERANAAKPPAYSNRK